MTTKGRIALRLSRWGLVPLMLLATVASASPTSATVSYVVTTLKNTKGEVVFSLRPVSTSFTNTMVNGKPAVDYSTTYKLTTLSKSLLTSAATSGTYGTLIIKDMNGTVCQSKEKLTYATVIKVEFGTKITATGASYPTEQFTWHYKSASRATC